MAYPLDNPVLVGLVFATGACIGSFLNVVIYRWPMRESILQPPSHCGSCGARLRVLDLIPVVSYLALRGRCRHCGHRFSARYALVEAATGLILVAAVLTITPLWQALAVFAVCCCLELVFFIDLDHMIIPDELVIAVAVIGIVLDASGLLHLGAVRAVSFPESIGGQPRAVYLPMSLVGIAVGGGAFMLVSAVFERVFRKPVLGFGDVKLAAAMGALFGPGYQFAAWFIVSVVLGAVVAVPLMALGVRKRGDYIPFGPMLAAGGIVLLLFPQLGAFVISRYGG